MSWKTSWVLDGGLYAYENKKEVALASATVTRKNYMFVKKDGQVVNGVYSNAYLPAIHGRNLNMAKKIFALLASSLLLFACSDNASDAEILSSTDFQNNDVVAKSEASFATNEGCKQNLLDELESESSYALAKSAAKSQVVENVYATGDMDKVEFWVNEDGSATAELEFWASCRYNVVDVWKNLDTLFVEALIRKSFEEVDSITGEPKIVEYEGVVSCICLTDVTVNFSAEYLGARYIELGTELSLIEYKKR